jgi:hypothetical protein
MESSDQPERSSSGFDVTTKVKESDLIDLWKYFEEQGNTVKGRMLNIVTLLLALATGLLGFAFKELKVLDGFADRAWVGVALSVLGLATCGYAAFLIKEFGNHMKRHWSSADFLLARIGGLGDIRDARRDPMKHQQGKLPTICRRVLGIVIVIGGLFAILLIYSLYSIKSPAS